MRAGRRFLTVLAATLGVLAASSTVAGAQAASGRVYFTQPSYVAHESQGELPITITRSDDSVGEDVRYGVATSMLSRASISTPSATRSRTSIPDSRRTRSTSRSSIAA